MLNFTSNEPAMTNVDRIIGTAVFEIIQARVVDHISDKMLIQHLKNKYVHIYETSPSVEESLHYEAALELLLSLPEY